jgi:UDP-N-acetylglucosamine 2-epimerase (non-hydrolysing)
MPKIALCHGTRPEQVKLAPVAAALRAQGAEVLEYDTVQSPDLGFHPEGIAGGIIWNGGLVRGVSGVLPAFRLWLENHAPVDAVLVQGDTATAFACALTAFLEGVPVGHVEAGLRTYASEPFPEEAFRRMIGALASWHFCPDAASRVNLVREGVNAGLHVTGNPVIDTLDPWRTRFKVLVTLHRRENWGVRILRALSLLDGWNGDGEKTVTAIRHPNWKSWMAPDALEDIYYIDFCEPLGREEMLDVLCGVDLVVTDSGGLQEEAAALGIPCFVLRTATERKALERVGAVTVIDPDSHDALWNALETEYRKRTAYGTRGVSAKIASILLENLTPKEATDAA